MKPVGEFKVLSVVQVIVPLDLFSKIQRLAHGANVNECQWFHCLRREITPRAINYHLEEIFIPNQEVSRATVDSPAIHMSALIKEIETANTVDGVLNVDAFNQVLRTMTCWAHSHVKMAPTPSGTDEENFKEWVSNIAQSQEDSPSMMLIVNQNDAAYIRIWDPLYDLLMENPRVVVRNPTVDFSYIDMAIKDRIKEKTPVIQTVQGAYSWATALTNSAISGSTPPLTQTHGRSGGRRTQANAIVANAFNDVSDTFQKLSTLGQSLVPESLDTVTIYNAAQNSRTDTHAILVAKALYDLDVSLRLRNLLPEIFSLFLTEDKIVFSKLSTVKVIEEKVLTSLIEHNFTFTPRQFYALVGAAYHMAAFLDVKKNVINELTLQENYPRLTGAKISDVEKYVNYVLQEYKQ